MTDESDINGTTPVTVDGPAAPGANTYQNRRTSELPTPKSVIYTIRKTPKSRRPSKSRASPTTPNVKELALSESSNNNGGLWVGYEDKDTAGYRASYAKVKSLGSIAVVDLSLDDFKGRCGRDKYDILRTAKTFL
jgi:chitinase